MSPATRARLFSLLRNALPAHLEPDPRSAGTFLEFADQAGGVSFAAEHHSHPEPLELVGGPAYAVKTTRSASAQPSPTSATGVALGPYTLSIDEVGWTHGTVPGGELHLVEPGRAAVLTLLVVEAPSDLLGCDAPVRTWSVVQAALVGTARQAVLSGPRLSATPARTSAPTSTRSADRPWWPVALMAADRALPTPRPKPPAILPDAVWRESGPVRGAGPGLEYLERPSVWPGYPVPSVRWLTASAAVRIRLLPAPAPRRLGALVYRFTVPGELGAVRAVQVEAVDAAGARLDRWGYLGSESRR